MSDILPLKVQRGPRVQGEGRAAAEDLFTVNGRRLKCEGERFPAKGLLNTALAFSQRRKAECGKSSVAHFALEDHCTKSGKHSFYIFFFFFLKKG